MEIMQYLSQGLEVLGGLLMVIGGLKVFARYTKSEWDDKALASIEKPLKSIKQLLGKGK